MTRTVAAVLLAFLLGALVGLTAPRPAASSTLAPQYLATSGGVAQGFPAGDQTRTSLRTPAPSAEPPAATAGLATWYCGSGSPCTAGYAPGDLVAAAGSELRTGDWRGRLVVVTSGGRSVAVRLVDACACPGPRIVDLSRAAFARLADPSRGVIAVTVTPAPTPPETDE